MSVLLAIANRDVKALHQALDAGEDPDGTDHEGVPALLHAADTGLVSLVAPLLAAGGMLETRDTIGWTPLMAAISQGSDELVAYLLESGANPNHVAREDTPLTIAMADAPLSIVVQLLASGATPDLRRPDGWTPLMLGAFRGETDRISVLLQAGADPTITMAPRLTDAATVAAAHGHRSARELLRKTAEERAPSMRSLWARVQRWCASHAPDIAARFESKDAESPLPAEWPILPRSVVELLTASPKGLPLFDYLTVDAKRAEEIRSERSGDDRAPLGLGADEPIQRSFWADAWFPIAEDRDGNLLLIDLNPTSLGVEGQLISWSTELGPIAVLASGVVPFLQHMASRLRRAELRLSSDGLGLVDA